jgi:hypothetical protein
MNTKERVEELRKQGYDYYTIYQKLDLTRDERLDYESQIKKERIVTNAYITFEELFFAMLGLGALAYYFLIKGL